MALNVSILAVPWAVFWIVLALVVAAIVALTIVEAKLGNRAKAKKQAEETYYQRKLSATVALQGDSNSFLISLDKVTREFFSEVVGMLRVTRYSELIDELKKRQMSSEAVFCQKMQEALYSGEPIDQPVLQSLFGQIRFFILRREKSLEREPVSKLQVVASSPVKSPAPIAVGVNSGILRYYQEGRRRGFESSVLTEQLLAAGFDKASVQNALLFLERESMKPRISPQTEKRILTRFSSPQKSEISLIKSSLEEKDEIGKAEIIEIIPYKKEEIPKKTVNYPSEEPEEYKKIENFDNLDRVKAKINLRKKGIIAG